MRLKLTGKQASLILWALRAGYEQNEKFLRHDDWDENLTKKQRYENMSVDRDFVKALKTFEKAYMKGGKNEKHNNQRRKPNQVKPV